MEIQNQYNLGSIFAFYASLTASLNLAKQFYHQFTPSQIREYINEKIQDWFSKQNILDPKLFTLEIAQNYDEEIGYSNHNNTIYYACESHLTKKLRSSSTCLKVYRSCAQQPLTYHLAQGEEFSEYVKLDEFGELIKLHWKFSCKNEKGEKTDFGTYRSFELIFDPRFKEVVLDYYLPEVLVKNYDKMIEMTKEINLFTFNDSSPCKGWRNVVFNHPFTFDALALDPDLKKSIVDDLDRFIRRKEFYKRIGRAWKRGYLLYGTPGTGKSSLIAAFANYLKFDVYDLQLASVDKDDTLRNLMMSISNKSILVIEDIDCASGLARNVALSRANVTSDDSSFTSDDDDIDDDNRNNNDNGGTISFDKNNTSLSLSGLLNFIDGLWSSCGDERIIILTTNYKERLDPALLRPGRMDMHIHMSYLRMPGFRVLASNYLGQTEEHPLFEEIEELLEKTNVSPAEVAEELIRSEDPDVALKSVLNLMNKKTKKRKVTKEKVDVLSDELDDEPLTKKQRNGDELNCYNGEC